MYPVKILDQVPTGLLSQCGLLQPFGCRFFCIFFHYNPHIPCRLYFLSEPRSPKLSSSYQFAQQLSESLKVLLILSAAPGRRKSTDWLPVGQLRRHAGSDHGRLPERPAEGADGRGGNIQRCTPFRSALASAASVLPFF